MKNIHQNTTVCFCSLSATCYSHVSMTGLSNPRKILGITTASMFPIIRERLNGYSLLPISPKPISMNAIFGNSDKGRIDGIKGYIDLDGFHEDVTLNKIELR